MMKSLTEKAQRYCAYAERCEFDVIKKLRSLGANESTINKITAQLQTDGYIDDERFALTFANGKFRNNRWGKTKIAAELFKRQIPESLISMAINDIDDESYRQCILFLINKKTKELAGKQPETVREKVVAYCIQKGFEYDLVWKTIDENDRK